MSENTSQEFLEKLLQEVIVILENESGEWRPHDSEGRPGGVILLYPELPTLIVPDLHGRNSYLPDLMRYEYQGKQVFDLLKLRKVQIVCVGDGMHGERRASARWRVAFGEYQKGFKECPAMAEEMLENFQTMAMVMRLKITFPNLFHFLKGNHENILDEKINGNHPFAKFAAEGPMTKMYVENFFGHSFLMQYDRFEKNLPLLARGKSLIISHARPNRVYQYEEIVNYRENPELIEGLTWTRHNTASSGSVAKMLDNLLGKGVERGLWFSGHTAVKDLYKLWPKDSFIEIHNPHLRVLVSVDPNETFDEKKHIFVLTATNDDGQGDK